MGRTRAGLGHWLSKTPVASLPVRVRSGLAKGARWTMLPHSAYWRGRFELDVDAAVRRLGDLRGQACWDIGAHFGIYTVGLAMAVGPTGQVAGFEPDPVAFAKCGRHVTMNRLAWVRLFQAAVSNTDGRAEMLKYGDFGTTTNHLRYPGEQGVGADVFPIATVALDSLVGRGEIRPPRFVKIDVEGHGVEALRGGFNTIRDRLPWIVMAFHSPDEYAGTRELLSPLGYTVRHCGTDQDYGWPAAYGDTGTDTFLLRRD